MEPQQPWISGVGRRSDCVACMRHTGCWSNGRLAGLALVHSSSFRSQYLYCSSPSLSLGSCIVAMEYDDDDAQLNSSRERLPVYMRRLRLMDVPLLKVSMWYGRS